MTRREDDGSRVEEVMAMSWNLGYNYKKRIASSCPCKRPVPVAKFGTRCMGYRGRRWRFIRTPSACNPSGPEWRSTYSKTAIPYAEWEAHWAKLRSQISEAAKKAAKEAVKKTAKKAVKKTAKKTAKKAAKRR